MNIPHHSQPDKVFVGFDVPIDAAIKIRALAREMRLSPQECVQGLLTTHLAHTGQTLDHESFGGFMASLSS